MTVWDSIPDFDEAIVDGDQLDDGYFNGNLNSEDSALQDLRGTNEFSYIFDTDEATTKTNFTYDGFDDTYTVIGTDAGTLILPIEHTQDTYGSPVEHLVSNWQYYIFTVYDECDNSSFDTDKWDAIGNSPSTSEDTSRARSVDTVSDINPVTYLSTDSTNGVFTDETYITQIAAAGAGAQGIISIVVYDGTDIVTIESAGLSTPPDPLAQATYTFKFDDTNTQVHVWKDGTSLAGSPFDLSSLDGTYMVALRGIQGQAGQTPTFTLDIYYGRVISGSETSAKVTSFSSDGGSNYTESIRSLTEFIPAEQGYEIIPKFTSTPAAGEGVTVDKVYFRSLPKLGE